MAEAIELFTAGTSLVITPNGSGYLTKIESSGSATAGSRPELESIPRRSGTLPPFRMAHRFSWTNETKRYKKKTSFFSRFFPDSQIQSRAKRRTPSRHSRSVDASRQGPSYGARRKIRNLAGYDPQRSRGSARPGPGSSHSWRRVACA